MALTASLASSFRIKGANVDGTTQLTFDFGQIGQTAAAGAEPPALSIDPTSYDRIVVAFSGGKDSLAMVLHLIELGLHARIELHHHDVDGRESEQLFDWPCTGAYVRAVADALGLPLYFSWRVGGIRQEMLKHNTPTAGIRFEVPGGEIVDVASSAQPNTRMMFPQVAASLRVRWCSSVVKIDVLNAVIRNQPRFNRSRTLVVTGERAQESANRAKYAQGLVHKADARTLLKRHVDHWRPVLHWTEEQVWDIIRAHGVVPHPGYQLGWSRLSCMTCIFGDSDQWATIRHIASSRFEEIARYEELFGKTIHRSRSVAESADLGAVYAATRAARQGLIDLALSGGPAWKGGSVIVHPADWVMPAGAFGHSTGPV